MDMEKASEALARLAARGDLELFNDLTAVLATIEESKDPAGLARGFRVGVAGAMAMVPAMMIANTAREFAKEGKAMLEGVGNSLDPLFYGDGYAVERFEEVSHLQYVAKIHVESNKAICLGSVVEGLKRYIEDSRGNPIDLRLGDNLHIEVVGNL